MPGKKLTESEAKALLDSRGAPRGNVGFNTQLAPSGTDTPKVLSRSTEKSTSGAESRQYHQAFTRARAHSALGNREEAYKAYDLEYQLRGKHDSAHQHAQDSAKHDRDRHAKAAMGIQMRRERTGLEDQEQKAFDELKAKFQFGRKDIESKAERERTEPAIAPFSDKEPTRAGFTNKREFNKAHGAWDKKKALTDTVRSEPAQRESLMAEHTKGLGDIHKQMVASRQAIVERHGQSSSTTAGGSPQAASRQSLMDRHSGPKRTEPPALTKPATAGGQFESSTPNPQHRARTPEPPTDSRRAQHSPQRPRAQSFSGRKL